MPKVYNRYHKDVPVDAVYVGRPTKWGNPFSHLSSNNAIVVATREEAVEKYKAWLIEYVPSLIELAKQELKGKDLVCWCAPKACHADILLEIANGSD
jgi:hypothetical protein